MFIIIKNYHRIAIVATIKLYLTKINQHFLRKEPKKYSAIYTLNIDNIDKQDDRVRLKNYPFEMLYPLNVLQENNLLKEISLIEYLQGGLSDELQKQKQEDLKNIENKVKYKLNNNETIAKENFAKQIIQNLDMSKDFEEIKNLIDRIEHYFKSFSSKNSTNAKPNKSHK